MKASDHAPALQNVLVVFLDRLDRFRNTLPEAESTELTGILTRRHLLDAPLEPWTNPAANPIIALPTWVAATVPSLPALRPLPQDAVADMVTASAFGYLHARVIDDQMDEGIGDPDVMNRLATRLMARHIDAFKPWFPAGAGFFHQVEARWAAFGQSMRDEARHLDPAGPPWTEASWLQSLDRLRPLHLSAYSVLQLAGADGPTRRAWHQIVEAIVVSGQLVHDLVDLGRDLREGRVSWIGDLVSARKDPNFAVFGLLLGPVFPTMERVLGAVLTPALASAKRLGADDIVQLLETRGDLFEAARSRFTGGTTASNPPAQAQPRNMTSL